MHGAVRAGRDGRSGFSCLQVIQTMAKPRRTTKQQSKQSGGTFLGVVLGLIVGLAIAVVVALYITRAPSPFVSKVAPPAAAPQASQPATQYDPNRALQGNSPGQPVPQTAQATQPASAAQSGMLGEPQIVEVPPSASAPAVAGNNAGAANGIAVAPSPAQSTAPKTAQQPNPAMILSNNQPQRPANAIQAPSANAGQAAEPNNGYFLQVGAYKTPADAEQQRARLAFQGFESKVTQRAAGGVTYYRVRIGPFTKFDDMNSTRQRLSDAGIDTAVIRFTKQ